VGKASSAKKVARLAQKGKGRKVRFQGGTLFPAVIVGISVVGLALIVYSRSSIPNQNVPPTVEDHWHASYGFYACDAWLPDLQGNKEELDSAGQLANDGFRRTGIHSHDDGVIHWHAYTSAATGRNAKLGVFLDVYGVKVSDTKIEFPADQGGAVYEEGVTKCTVDGKEVDGEVVVYAFDAYDNGDDYSTYITNFDQIRLKNDAMAFSIVFAPAGSDPELPPSAASLPELGAADMGTNVTTTVAGDASTTTVAGLHHHESLMRAVVLVGGFGTRLRPLTLTTPKPMLPVGHRPIVENLVRMLSTAGITEVVLGLGFKPEPFVAAFPDGECAGVRLHYAVEPEPLDTAGAIKFAAEHAGIDDTFVVVNGDVLTDLDVSALIAFHRSTGAEATIHLTPVQDPSAYGVVALAEDGRVERFVEKPAPGTAPSNLINAGTYVLEPSVLARIPSGRKVSIERETFPSIVADGRLFAMSTDDYWIDTGRPEPYLRANLDMIDGVRRTLRADGVQDGARVDGSARVSHSLISRGAVVGSAAVIEDSVVLGSAVIDDGAVIKGSIVMGRVGRASTIIDTVVGAEGRVEDGVVLSHAFVPDPNAVK
jgi:mannose-1-phosphate guanylyltransferase